jgi:hypothetical protein
MSYSFNPMSDEELEASTLLPDGEYDFEVSKSERQISSSQNPMAKLTLKCWDKDGVIKYVYDYLVFSPVQLCIRKVKHFCDTTGLLNEYNAGQIPEELENLTGRVCIKISTGNEIPEDKLKGKPKGSRYPDKNEVVDYIKRGDSAVPDAKPEEPFFEDDINF